MSAGNGDRRVGREKTGPVGSHDTLILPRGLLNGVQEGAVGAEVDEVEETDVGAQLLGGRAEIGAHGGDVEHGVGFAAALQQVGRAGP